MLKHSLVFFALILGIAQVQAQELESFRIYNKAGDSLTFYEMTDDLAEYDVVLFGEYHNNSIVHWLELQLTKTLFRQKDSMLVLGAEMLERHQQEGVNYYLNGTWDAEKLRDSLKMWKNFKTDYLPLLKFAKKHQLTFIATNVPRSYAGLVAQKSKDTLSELPEKEQQLFVDLPYHIDMETPGYQQMIDMMTKHHGGMDFDPQLFVQAQALKDATMAESILENRKRGQLFLHFNGNYHSKKYGGIYWYLKKHKPNLKVAVITIFKSKKKNLPLPDGENKVYTEFNIVVPKDMTKTY